MVKHAIDEEDLFCSCPGCNATFRLPYEKLTHREGMVRCGVCRRVFDANLNLLRRTPDGFLALRRHEIELSPGPAETDSLTDEELNAEDDADITGRLTRSEPEAYPENRQQDPGAGIEHGTAWGKSPGKSPGKSSGKSSGKSDLLVSALDRDDDVPVQDIRNPFEDRRPEFTRKTQRAHGERFEPVLRGPAKQDGTPDLTIPEDIARTQRRDRDEPNERLIAPTITATRSGAGIPEEAETGSHTDTSIINVERTMGTGGDESQMTSPVTGTGNDGDKIHDDGPAGRDPDQIAPVGDERYESLDPEIHRDIVVPPMEDPFRSKERADEPVGFVEHPENDEYFSEEETEPVSFGASDPDHGRSDRDAALQSETSPGYESGGITGTDPDIHHSEPKLIEIPESHTPDNGDSVQGEAQTPSTTNLRGPNFSDPSRRTARRYMEPDTVPLEEEQPSFPEDSVPSEVSQNASLNIQESTLGRMHKNEVEEFISEQRNPIATFVWFMVAMGFLFLLGMQVKYFMVEKYAQDEQYRKYLAGFCRIAQCELPPRQDPYLLTLTHTKIDLHPTQPGALRVTVKMVNEAQFSQPFPMLQVTLTDRVGRIVGRRTFNPDAYLPAGSTGIIGEGELTSILFDLARPHEKAVGFVVDIVTEAERS